MKFLKKKFSLFFIFFAIVLPLFFLAWFFFEIKISPKKNPVNFGFKEIKKEADFLQGKIYSKAEEHNPKGDFLPDWVDDLVKKGIKEAVSFWQ